MLLRYGLGGRCSPGAITVFVSCVLLFSLAGVFVSCGVSSLGHKAANVFKYHHPIPVEGMGGSQVRQAAHLSWLDSACAGITRVP